MAKSEANNHTLSTHARLIISDWQPLREVILFYSKRLRQSSLERAKYEANIPILNDRQLDDALQGPATEFIHHLLQAYALLSAARFEVNMQEDPTFTEENNKKIELEKKNTKSRKQLLKTLKMNDIRKIQQNLDKLTKQQLQQWQNAAMHWSKHINQQLQAVGFYLTEAEYSELSDNEPKSEIYGRYTDIHLDLPKTKTNCQNFSDYFYLKTYLLVHSNLSMQQQPNQPENILNVLKQIKQYFEQITKESSYLADNQKKQMDEAVKDIRFLAL